MLKKRTELNRRKNNKTKKNINGGSKNINNINFDELDILIKKDDKRILAKTEALKVNELLGLIQNGKINPANKRKSEKKKLPQLTTKNSSQSTKKNLPPIISDNKEKNKSNKLEPIKNNKKETSINRFKRLLKELNDEDFFDERKLTELNDFLKKQGVGEL